MAAPFLQREDDNRAPRPHYVFVIDCCITMKEWSGHWWSGSDNPPLDADDTKARNQLIADWNTRPADLTGELIEALTELLRVDDDWHGAVNSEMASARSIARAVLAKVNIQAAKDQD